MWRNFKKRHFLSTVSRSTCRNHENPPMVSNASFPALLISSWLVRYMDDVRGQLQFRLLQQTIYFDFLCDTCTPLITFPGQPYWLFIAHAPQFSTRKQVVKTNMRPSTLPHGHPEGHLRDSRGHHSLTRRTFTRCDTISKGNSCSTLFSRANKKAKKCFYFRFKRSSSHEQAEKLSRKATYRYPRDH